ncbi:hypothetical protein GF359_06145 [candidate division WOR-3 bacterium]|uniref:HEAT repeat domain-containing protein n=1 Tax=candidate division WOR-3 bacterium TaxID=2052148 RepID=A0A9D5KAX5_UNCW3|nr:hypothetical protein [candidate division WOR-3 bacterium]MBD3364780.1 hypothetical protein [candidate division WOR-3 bacterium]
MDIIGLIFWAMYMGRKTQAKGYTKGKGAGIAVGFWLGLEIGLALAGLFIALAADAEEAICIAVPFGLIGIGLGMLFSWFVVKRMPVKKQQVLAFLRSKQGSDKERRDALLALAELGHEALPDLVQLYQHELEWPTFKGYHDAIVEAVVKAGGREYLEKAKRGEV